MRAHDENCKQLELEKKKAQKDAENEKMKISTPKKAAENLLQQEVQASSNKTVNTMKFGFRLEDD